MITGKKLLDNLLIIHTKKIFNFNSEIISFGTSIAYNNPLKPKVFYKILVSAGYAIISTKNFHRSGISIFVFLLERQKKIYHDNPVNLACPVAPADGSGSKRK